MNKLATISLVTVLGVAGGGAYMMNSNPDFDLAQYIPEPVTDLLNEYVPEEYKPAFLTKSTQAEQQVIQEQQQVTTPQQDDSNVFLNNPEQENKVQNIVEGSMENTEQGNINVSMEEIQNALGKELAIDTEEPAQAVEAVKKEVSNNPKVTNIEKKIDVINAEISKLDSENEQLKDTFQQILKKNRELAKQLKAIDDQLTTTN